MQVNQALIATSALSAAFLILFPLVLAVVLRPRLGVGWRSFFAGALVFTLVQTATRVPAVQLIQAAIGPQLRAAPGLEWGWLVVLALTAGLFEEVGRYLGYRWLIRVPRTWAKGVFYGLGHGAAESVVLLGFSSVASLISILSLANGGLDAVPADVRLTVEAQVRAFLDQPAWLPLLGMWERACTLAIHAALSVVVLQALRGGGLRWLWLAVAAHALGDFVVVAIPQVLGRSPGVLVGLEVIVGLYAALALWAIFRLRERDAGQGADGATRETARAADQNTAG